MEVEGACLGNGSCLQLYLGRRLPSSSEPISLVRNYASRLRTSKTDKSGWGSALGRGLSTRPPRASSVRAHSSLHFAIHRYYFIYSLSTRIPESASSRRKRNAMSMLNSALSRRPCPRHVLPRFRLSSAPIIFAARSWLSASAPSAQPSPRPTSSCRTREPCLPTSARAGSCHWRPR